MALTLMQDMHYLSEVLQVNTERAGGFFHFILLGGLAFFSEIPKADREMGNSLFFLNRRLYPLIAKARGPLSKEYLQPWAAVGIKACVCNGFIEPAACYCSLG